MTKKENKMKKFSFLLLFALTLMAIPKASAQESIWLTNTTCDSYTTVNWSLTSGIPENIGVYVTAPGFGGYQYIGGANQYSGSQTYPIESGTYGFSVIANMDSDFDPNTGEVVTWTDLTCP
jgi:hypothetical protein